MTGFKYPAAGLANLAGQSGGGGGIKSVQKLVINEDKSSIPNTWTFATPVDMSQTLLFTSWKFENTNDSDFPTIELINNNTIEVNNDRQNLDAVDWIVIYILEFDGLIKSMQRGVLNFSYDVETEDLTISSVDTSKTIVNVTGYRSDTTERFVPASGNLIDSTTVRFRHKQDATFSAYVSYEIAEFK